MLIRWVADIAIHLHPAIDVNEISGLHIPIPCIWMYSRVLYALRQKWLQ